MSYFSAIIEHPSGHNRMNTAAQNGEQNERSAWRKVCS